MAIALTTFLLFLFLIPGILFENALNTSHGETINKNPLSASFMRAVIAAAVVHGLGLAVVYTGPDIPDPDFTRIYAFLSGSSALSPVKSEAWAFAAYLAALIIAGHVAGSAMRLIIDKFNLSSAPVSGNFFRNDGSWASTLREPSLRDIETWRDLRKYLKTQNSKLKLLYPEDDQSFKEYLENNEYSKRFYETYKNTKFNKFIVPYVIVKIIDDHENTLYKGEVLSFETNESGELTRIKLINAEKKIMDSRIPKFKAVAEGEFVLNCKNFSSINIMHLNTAETFLGEPCI